MAHTLHPAIVEQITSTVKLTGNLISDVHEYQWAIDDPPAVLPELIAELQAIGKVLSALRKYCISDWDLGLSVLQRITVANGPVAECAAELGRLRVKVVSDKGDGGFRTLMERGHLMPYMRQLEKHRAVFAFALKVLQDQTKLSEAMEGYICDPDGPKVELDDPLLRAVQDLEKRKKSLSWLYSGDYESALQGVQERSVPGTGEWLPQSLIFRKWVKGDRGFLLLWGRGSAGAGKTHISAKIINHIQAMPQTPKYAVAYFFFAHMDGQPHPKDVLRCLILQLACQAKYFQSICRVLRLHLEKEQLPPTVAKLSRTLITTSRLFERVFLVLDGLDEYEHRSDLVPLFGSFVAANINVLVTGYPPGTGSHPALHEAVKIDLSARDQDVKTYIQQKISASPIADRLLGQDANRVKFISDLTKCANGMQVIYIQTMLICGVALLTLFRFLYVHLGVRSMLQQPTVNDMFTKLRALETSPFRKDQYNIMYTWTTTSIRAQPENRASIAVKILYWVVKARQTLTVSALREAIAVTAGAGKLDKLNLCDPQTMIEVCHDLITVDEGSGKVRLVHHTARDCLLKIIPVDAEHQMAMACLTYLSYRKFSKIASLSGDGPQQSLEDRFQAHPFYEYAAKHLSGHINACDLSLTTEALVRLTWNEGNIESYFQVHGMSYCGKSKERLPLRLAVHVGHLPVVCRFLDQGIDPFVPDQEGQTALHWAVCRNHIHIARLLLDCWRERVSTDDDKRKGGLWRIDKEGKNVLHLAARKGFMELVKLFLDHNADISMMGNGGQTPLHEAVKGGHENIVQLLLENGADSLSTEELGQTALHVAAEGGHLSIVTRLIECRNNITPRIETPNSRPVSKKNERCDVSATDDQDVTPLHLAALAGHTEIVRVLLAEGANPSARDKTGETVLHQAVRGGDIPSVQLVVDHGADVMARDNRGGTVLHRAATRGYGDIIEILLKNRAHISLRLVDNKALELALEGGFEVVVQLLRSNGATAHGPTNVDRILAKATWNGDDGLVELLLSYGANPSGTLLITAAEYGHLNVVKLFLNSGANILFRDGNNRSVLQVAVEKGHQEVVRLALDNGAEIAEASEAQRMLEKAAGAGHRGIVQLLLNHGMDTCGQALYAAASSGHLDVVIFLLARGTDIHFRHSNNQTVFHAAVYNGHQDVAELLLRHGADIHARGENQQTALHQASYGSEQKGHEGLVLLLLKAGTDISIKDTSGRTAMILASRGGPIEIVRALSSHGADAAIQDMDGWTALHHAANGGHTDIVRLLSSQSAVLNVNGQTPLVLAASNGHQEILRALLPDSHNKSEIPEEIHAAFFLAAANGHHEATSLLLRHGASVKKTNKDGRTAFLSVIEKGCSEVLEIFLRFNADISEKTADGESALFVAARNGHVDIIRMLLDAGANVSETNENGQTALFVAGRYDQSGVYSLLIEKGVDEFARDRNGDVAWIEIGQDYNYEYDYDPWSPHGW